MNRFSTCCLFLALLFCGAVPAEAAEIWTGPKITFSKAAFADVTDPVSQDRITSNVWLTRANSSGLYNIRQEAAYQFNVSPSDTQWSFGTTADLGSLVFTDWRTAVGGDPPASVGQDMVLHLITDDIYIDIKFLSWGMPSTVGGFFSYERSTRVVPEAAAMALILSGVLCVGATGLRIRCG